MDRPACLATSSFVDFDQKFRLELIDSGRSMLLIKRTGTRDDSPIACEIKIDPEWGGDIAKWISSWCSNQIWHNFRDREDALEKETA